VISDYDLVVGFDTEYVRGSHLDDSIPDDDNAVVSYQMAVYAPTKDLKKSGIIPTEGLSRRNRLSMRGFLGQVVAAAIAEGMIPPTAELKIALVAHFSRADLPGFRDFKSLKKSFDAVRKTFCSINRPAIFDVNTPSGTRIRVSVRLFDTRLLAPAGAGSLRKLGELLRFDKLELPDVLDEAGNTRAGIERMDLTLVQHPDVFNAYAIRDAEIAVEWLQCVNELQQAWGLAKPAYTIGSMAVAKFEQLVKTLPEFDLLQFFGKQRVGRKKEPLEQLLAIRGLAADCFHGGRNECFEHGVYRTSASDWDLKGAYTSALAMFRQLDWSATEHTIDLSRLVALDVVTFARVKFQFPPGTRFPSLPVDADDYGLVYPLSGESCATGPELVVALGQGATIQVIEGVVVPWQDADGPRPFLEFTKVINLERAKYPKGAPLELLVKEAGNSLYGKTAQAVASYKSAPRTKRVFDTRQGAMTDLDPSSLTQPLVAALTTGLLRAVLSEIIANLPPHVTVFTATTDGWLSTATEAEARAAVCGPVARYFGGLRAVVDPKGDASILEMKHSADALLVCKTRGTFTIAPGGPMPKPIIARAGHRLETPFDDPAAEAAEWERVFRAREFNTRMPRRQFISVRAQWYANADLIDIPRVSRANLDYDLKRRPVCVHDHEGLIRFSTEPWPDVDTFIEYRRTFDRWRRSAETCLKTAEDWHRFLSWKQAPRSGAASARTAYANAVVAAYAKGLPGFPVRGRGRYGTGMSRVDFAAWLASVGIHGVTAKTFENCRVRDPDPTGSVSVLTPGDYELIARLGAVLSREAIASLLTGKLAAVQQPETEFQTITLIPSPPSKVPENAAPAETAIDPV
jgi:hypothetical protein